MKAVTDETDAKINVLDENVGRIGLIKGVCDFAKILQIGHRRSAWESCVPVRCSTRSGNPSQLSLSRPQTSFVDN